MSQVNYSPEEQLLVCQQHIQFQNQYIDNLENMLAQVIRDKDQRIAILMQQLEDIKRSLYNSIHRTKAKRKIPPPHSKAKKVIRVIRRSKSTTPFDEYEQSLLYTQ